MVGLTLRWVLQSLAGVPPLTHAWSTPPKYPGTPTSPGFPGSSGAVQTWSRAAANQVRADALDSDGALLKGSCLSARVKQSCMLLFSALAI